jgi:hypothetical protein
MIESPFIAELLADPKVIQRSPVVQRVCADLRQTIRHFLTNRFLRIPKALIVAIKKLDSLEQLTSLVEWAAVCPSLAAFRTRLPS